MISGAGNGWGKSELLVALFTAAMWPHLAPPELSHDLFKNWALPKRARIYSTPAELEEVGSIQTAIKKYFPKGRYEVTKGHYNYPSVFKTDTGWVLDMFSYERDEKEAGGPNIGLQGFNEPPPEELWKEALVRSRAGGIIVGGMTSLKDNPWIVDGILAKDNGKEFRIRYGSSCENCKTHGVNGHLKHEQIERILSQFDQDEREARFSGKPLSLSGRIYKAFNRHTHVVPAEPIPDGVGHYMVVDPAIGKPMAVIWAYVDESKTVTIYREWPNFDFHGAKDSNMAVGDYTSLFKRLEASSGRNSPIQDRIIDRHFANKRSTPGGATLKQEFHQAGMLFQDSYSMDEEVETGILKVKEYLAKDNLGRCKLRIFDTCTNTIASFERWGRNPDNGKPLEDYKDFADVARYLLMANPEIYHPKSSGLAKQPYYRVGG